MYACMADNVEIVHFLLESGSDVGLVDNVSAQYIVILQLKSLSSYPIILS
jgi:hypothetical protein